MDLVSEIKARRMRLGLAVAQKPMVSPEIAAKLVEARKPKARVPKPKVMPEPEIPARLQAKVIEARDRLVGCYASKETKLEILVVLEDHDVTWLEVVGPSRVAKMVAARREVCRLLHGRGWSYGKIGDFVNRDHTSVMHAVKSGELV